MDPEPAPPGGDPGAPPAFDIAKAFADLTANVNKTLNGFAANQKKELDKRFASVPPPVSDPPTIDPEPSPDTPQIDSVRKSFERKTADAIARMELAEKAMAARDQQASDREKAAQQKVLMAELKTELGKFVDPSKVNAAFKLYDREVKYNDDGQMVGPDDTPLADYIKTEMSMRENEYLLPTKQVSGAGATAGSVKGSTLDLDNLKVGMDPAELVKFRAHIADVAQKTLSGHRV